MYLFYRFCTTLHVSNDHFVHQQEFLIYTICSAVQTIQTCLGTPDDERIGRSKHGELYKKCRINTYSASCRFVYVTGYDERYVQRQNVAYM